MTEREKRALIAVGPANARRARRRDQMQTNQTCFFVFLGGEGVLWVSGLSKVRMRMREDGDGDERGYLRC